MKLNYNKQLNKVKRWVAPVGRKEYLKLDLNENYSVFTDELIKDLVKVDYFALSCYPEYDRLIGLLAKYTNSNPKNITLVNGADQAIDLLLRLFFNNKSKVIMPSPVFSMYDHVFSVLGSKIKHIPYKLIGENFEFPIEKIQKELMNSDGIVICNPNNPLGSIIKTEHLIEIIELTFKYKIPCIVDEAYFEFYGDTVVNLVKKYLNLIVIRTFSKIFGIAGLRLGYVVADGDITKQLLKIRGPWDVNHFAVSIGETLLENKDIFLSKLKETKKIRQKLVDFCLSLGLEVYRSEANFVIVKFNDSTKAFDFFVKNGILVNDISDYPYSNGILKGCIRITIPNSVGFEKLKSVLLKFVK